MNTIALAVVAALAAVFASPASAQVNTPVACTSFTGFPLNLSLGVQVGNTSNVLGSEAPRCSNQKIMAAVNALNTTKLDKSGGTLTDSLLVTPGTITPQAIYSAAYPGINFSDTAQHVLNVIPGTTSENNAAVAGYARSASGRANFNGSSGNAVSLFGSGYVDADNSALWGINTLLTDAPSRAVASGTGRILVNELDFNVMSPGTQVIGLSIGGNSLAQPTNANGFLVNSLGTGIKWRTAYWSLDGAANQGLVLGALQTSGANIRSQPIWIQAFDGSGTKHTGVIQQNGAYVTFADITQGAWPGVKIQLGDLALDAGHGVIVNGETVLGGRQHGWTTGVGTPNRGVYSADYTQTISATYSQAQVQALQNQLLATQQRVLALENDLRAHGLIGN